MGNILLCDSRDDLFVTDLSIVISFSVSLLSCLCTLKKRSRVAPDWAHVHRRLIQNGKRDITIVVPYKF
jgi:hypothetical protein